MRQGSNAMNVMTYDSEYLTRLRQRDPDTCSAFVSSMTPVLEARLRGQFRDHGCVEDVRNETLYRVFSLVDGDRVREPAQLGSFVRGVCDRVAHETRRKTRSIESLPEGGLEQVDRQPPLDSLLVAEQMHVRVRRELSKMREADRRLLIETHFEERDRRLMARERGVSASGLNVRLCRAVKRLRAQVLNETPEKQPLKTCRPAQRTRRGFR
ncbi:MAG TPA: sigma-70 family RNA polymerase sigma factor [Bryobacteraceae bacterium]|nr:sigma-70 family RNA polymerase sigma factor [Bryobacteraceae bacterium]